jgi:D-citramalate synthase
MKINVLDTTLRDGEQTPGVAFTPDGKLEIARALDGLGVDIIEAGAAIASEGERRALKLISKEGLKAEVCSFARVKKEDIDKAVECGVDGVTLVVPTSDIHLKYKLRKKREEVKQMTKRATRYAVKRGLKVELLAEDATRSNSRFLKEIFETGISEGAQRICVCDTVGVLTPEKSREMFAGLTEVFKVPVAVHCHNDFGMATANTVAAVQAGAREVHVTINGLGERAGNAALEEVVLTLSRLYGFKTGVKLKKLYPVSRLVERHSRLPVPPTKAVVGENAFSHETGIHTHGVLAYPPTYEPLSPELVGHHRRIVLGKHIGSHAVRSELKRLNIKASQKQVTEILEQIKKLGDRGKVITDAEWRAVVDGVMHRSLQEIVKLEELTVVSGNRVTPTASIRLKFADKEVGKSGVGTGPVDAAINAVRKVVEDMVNVKLMEYHVDAISGGTDALVDVVVKVTDGTRILTARGSNSDIIMASVQAVLSGVNRLLWDKKIQRKRD